MTTLTAPAPAKAHPARQKAIGPYLEKLEGWCNSAPGSQDLDRAARITIGTQQLVLEPWERAQLLQFFAGSREGIPLLVAHGAALVIKSTLDVERLKQAESNTSAEIYALQAELMLDTAIGMALLHETDLATTQEVQGGQVEAARSLSTFRHKLSRGVAEARKRIADSERQQAEVLAGSMTDRPFTRPAAAAEPSVAPAHVNSLDPAVQTLIEEASAVADGAPRRRRRRRPAPGRTLTGAPLPEPVPAPSRTRVLALSACALALIWLASVQLPPLLSPELKPIEAAELGSRAELTVVARPPSLFVTVPEIQWESMETVDQDALIDTLSAVASREGYTGAQVATDRGKPVARWLQARGGERVLTSDEEAPLP